MLDIALLLLASVSSPDMQAATPVRQSKNGEFIFSKYPPRALAAGEQGSVTFRAEVDGRGNVLSCDVTKSSGYKRLDEETCELIVRHATFGRAFDGNGHALETIRDGVVNWRIAGSSTPAAVQVASPGGRNLDKIVCKRIERTGSLVAHSRLCLTAREWEKYADETQDFWGELQGRKGTTHGN